MIKEKSIVMEKVNKVNKRKSNEVEMEKEVLCIDNEHDSDVEHIAEDKISDMDLIDTSTVIIDRDEEDRDVAIFQDTGDMKLLEKLYRNRIPTLKSWANKHYYPGLTSSVEDLFEELSFVFVKAAQKYERKRGNFNNCLFTFLLNRLKNLKSSKHAKKRVSDKYDGPISGMILSLDYCYNDKDGSQITLKDILSNPETMDKSYIHRNASFEETINVLSANNPQFKDFLVKVSQGGSLTSLIKEYKTKHGKIKVDSKQAKILSKRKSKKTVYEIIKSNDTFSEEFKVVNYSLDKACHLTYEIELKNTKETDNIMRSLRELKKNKDIYIDKIRGLS
jgi:hypothetical protein